VSNKSAIVVKNPQTYHHVSYFIAVDYNLFSTFSKAQVQNIKRTKVIFKIPTEKERFWDYTTIYKKMEAFL
jgi:hypothetical protein